MKKVSASGNVHVKKSKIHGAGRGVFANRDIKKGEVIETCPIIEIPAHEMSSMRESILITYFFFYGRKKDKALLALGNGSIYNHSHEPNAKYKVKLKRKTITFTALANIEKDIEITFNYKQGNPQNILLLWFE